jgi:hypothetical protein
LRAVQADATDFPFPAGPLVVYLWNPFESEVFTRVLANLEAALAQEPRDIFIVYVQPDLESLLQASPCWRKVWRDEIPMSDEDYAAHAFPPRVEVCCVYRNV